MSRKITILLFSLLLSCCVIEDVAADDIKDKETFVEADYIKSGENRFYAKGHVIVRKTDALINADEVKAIKLTSTPRSDSKNKQYNKHGNVASCSNIDDNKDDDSRNKHGSSEKYIFNVNNWVRVRTKNDDIIYAKEIFENENNGTGWIKNAHIFPGQKYQHTELYSTQIDKTEEFYSLTNTSICPCKIFLDENVERNRKHSFPDMKTEEEILEKPTEQNATGEDDDKMHEKIKKTILSMQTGKMLFDKTNNSVTFEKLRLRLLGLTFLYIPKFTFHADDSGDSGFLTPQMKLFGSRQFGLEIPFYWKISPNMDFIISRSQYFDIKKAPYMEDPAQRLGDINKYRANTTQFTFRHLVSNKYGYENFYSLSAMVTDPTQLVDDKTGQGRVRNGDIVKGMRWIADFKAYMKLSNTTFLHIDQNYASDKNMMYMYKYDFRQIQTNKFHLFDVTEDRYISAEVYNYQSRLLNIDTKTTPVAYPILRADYNFKKDKLGGNFYVKSKAYYLNRQEGFTSGVAGIDGGYHLPYFLKSGTKITFDSMIRVQYNHVDFNDISGESYAPGQYEQQPLIYYYGNYLNFLKNKYYGTPDGKFDKIGALNFNKIQAEHAVVLDSIFGKTIVTPKFAVRYSPNHGRDILVPAEDNIGMQMNYYNAFNLTQSDGYGVYDTGGSAVYGVDFTHKVSKKIEITGGIAQNARFSNAIDEDILAEFTGFRRSMSDIMGHLGINIYNFSQNGYFNYDVHNKEIRMAGIEMSYNNRYITLTANYNTFSKNATIFQQPLQIVRLNMSIMPTKKLKLLANVNYNINGSNEPASVTKRGLINFNAGIYYIISCIQVGFLVSRNNISMANIPSTTIYRFQFSLVGF